jgi:hypothetical protein
VSLYALWTEYLHETRAILGSAAGLLPVVCSTLPKVSCQVELWLLTDLYDEEGIF